MARPDAAARWETLIAVAKRQTRTINGLKVTLVDVGGTYVAEMTPGSAQRHNSPNFRLRAAVIETPNGPYFIKLTGPAKTIAASEKSVETFLSSLKYRLIEASRFFVRSLALRVSALLTAVRKRLPSGPLVVRDFTLRFDPAGTFTLAGVGGRRWPARGPPAATK